MISADSPTVVRPTEGRRIGVRCCTLEVPASARWPVSASGLQ
ncbi:MAG: hypothetical protein ACM3Q3_03980 [Nitrospirota bacterium]